MLVLEFSFLVGRYHATPWGRNVNEGDPEWPPSPYRLVRTLIDIQKRHLPEWDDKRLERILRLLGGRPRFLLPQAHPAHIKTFLHSNHPKDIESKQLIFDSFMVISGGASMFMVFDIQYSADVLQDLSRLLGFLNYLGRSESMVRITVSDNLPAGSWNCVSSWSENTGYSALRIACVIDPEEYRQHPVSKTLPWLQALCLSTDDLLKEGWSSPPALDDARYMINRKSIGLSVQSSTDFRFSKPVRSVTFAVHPKVRINVRDTVILADAVRAYLMGIHRRIRGGDPASVSARFSGKTQDAVPLLGHSHAFFLPLDEDSDGWIDHIKVISRDPFDVSELQALDCLTEIHQFKGHEDIKLVLVSTSDMPRETWSQVWISTTPFITVRHYRQSRGRYSDWLTAEIIRDIENHQYPLPQNVQLIPWTMSGPKPIRWMEFKRNKKNEETRLRGHGCILSFRQAVAGPFSLGALCHYGLGLFMPMPQIGEGNV